MKWNKILNGLNEMFKPFFFVCIKIYSVEYIDIFGIKAENLQSERMRKINLKNKL